MTTSYSADVKQELLKLNKGQLFIFLELLNALVEKPDSFHPNVAAILQNLENMQFLINTLRPDQVGSTSQPYLRTGCGLRSASARIEQKYIPVVDGSSMALPVRPAVGAKCSAR